MKKSFLLFAIILLIILSGCVPAGMTVGVYDLGNEALQTANDYINADISGSDAVEKLDAIYDKLDRLYEKYDNEETSTESLKKCLSAIDISGAVSSLRFSIAIYCVDSSSYDDVITAKDKLAELLNE